MATKSPGSTKGFCFAATVFCALCNGVAKKLITRRTEFQRALLAWYRVHARQLPWREAPSLYKTVVSEFMLQQTQVKTVLPYLARWLAVMTIMPNNEPNLSTGEDDDYAAGYFGELHKRSVWRGFLLRGGGLRRRRFWRRRRWRRLRRRRWR